MNSSELYKKAFAAQFDEKNAPEAIHYYEELLSKFPHSYEASMAKQQIGLLRDKTATTKPDVADIQTQFPKQPSQQKNPVELLDIQVQILTQLYKQQLKQQEQLEQLRKEVTSERKVRITDLNMPFWSLVGFIVKVSFAAIPAYIIIGIFILFPLAILGGCGLLGLGVR